MDELLQEFIAETRETLEALTGELIVWEANPADKDRLDQIFRFFHTVKGSCGFLNLPRFEKLSHAAEDVLSQLRESSRKPSPALVNAILAIIDRIAALTEALETGNAIDEGEDADLIAALASDGEARPADTAASEIEGGLSEGSVMPAIDQGLLRSIRVPLDLLETMMNGVSDMVLARNEVARCLRDQANDPATENAFDRLSTCIAEMRDAIGQTRMQRIERIFAPLPRLVRDLAQDLGKKVELTCTGNDVELDREMIEMIRDPLTHLIRNAVDHGIETPGERVAAGKDPKGSIKVSARQSGNQILIELHDDGRGISTEKLVAKAETAKLYSRAELQAMSEADKLQLIFAPGLSTAQKVTAISGRGVGMDVVRSNVERIGGGIELENAPGKGLKLTMRVPLTLTIIACLTVEAADQQFALPRGAIREILFEESDQVRLETVGGTEIAYIRGEAMPHVKLEKCLGLPVPESFEGDDRTLVTLNAADGMRYALNVASVLDHEELVIRPGSPLVMSGGLFAGTTLPDNGRPMLLLDPLGIAARAKLRESGETMRSIHREAAGPARKAVEHITALLFRDFDNRLRGVRLALVERVEDMPSERIGYSAGQMRVEVDGRAWPVYGLDAVPDQPKVKMLHLTDGDLSLYYAVQGVVDIHNLAADIQPSAESGVVGGVALLAGQQVEMIDAHWLFAEYSHVQPVSKSRKRPVCCLAGEEDSWTREILGPLLESAGYELAFDDGGELDADIYLMPEGAARPANARGPVIELRSQMRRSEAAEASGLPSIYRYDRIGLLSALQSDLARLRSA